MRSEHLPSKKPVQRFGLRSLSVGLASVLVSSTVAVNSVNAHAETVSSSAQTDDGTDSSEVTTKSGVSVSIASTEEDSAQASEPDAESANESSSDNAADVATESEANNADGESQASVSTDSSEQSNANTNDSESTVDPNNAKNSEESSDDADASESTSVSENSNALDALDTSQKTNASDNVAMLSASLLVDANSSGTINSLSEAKNYSNYDHSSALADPETAKASYKKGENVPVSFAFANSTNTDQKITATMTIYYGVNPVGEVRSVTKYLKAGESYDVAANTADQNQFTIDNSWLENNKGYTVQIKVTDSSGNQIGLKNLGLAIEDDWTKFPRYGVIAGSGSHAYGIPNDPELMKKYAEQIEEMKNMHVNSYFFYDVYKDAANPFPDEESYTQEWATWTSNKPQISTQAIKDLVSKVHDTNAVAMLYNMIHARNTYENTENTPGLPDDSQLMYNATDGAFGSKGQPMSNSAAAQEYYNPASPAWQKFIAETMIEAMKRGNFDGWNGDTIGGNVVTTSEDRETDKTFQLEDTYGYFSKAIMDAFKGKKPDGSDYYYTINNVNAGGLTDSLPNVSVAYTELWPSGYFDGHSTTEYGDLKNVVDYVRDKSGKSLIVSAYLKNNSIGNDNTYNTNAELLTTASIAAAGGYHMELDANANNNDEYGTGVLGSEYYPNQDHKVSEDLNRLLYQYSQFQVQYENILRGDGVTNDTAMAKTYNSDGNQVSRDENNSTDAGRNGNQVWTFTKKGDGFKTIQLINLMGINSDWDNTSGNNNKNPEVQKNLTVVYPLGQTSEDQAKALASHVYVTSPDDWSKGSMTKVSAEVVNNGDGTYSLKINVPELSLWDMVYIPDTVVESTTQPTDNGDSGNSSQTPDTPNTGDNSGTGAGDNGDSQQANESKNDSDTSTQGENESSTNGDAGNIQVPEAPKDNNSGASSEGSQSSSDSKVNGDGNASQPPDSSRDDSKNDATNPADNSKNNSSTQTGSDSQGSSSSSSTGKNQSNSSQVAEDSNAKNQSSGDAKPESQSKDQTQSSVQNASLNSSDNGYNADITATSNQVDSNDKQADYNDDPSDSSKQGESDSAVSESTSPNTKLNNSKGTTSGVTVENKAIKSDAPENNNTNTSASTSSSSTQSSAQLPKTGNGNDKVFKAVGMFSLVTSLLATLINNSKKKQKEN